MANYYRNYYRRHSARVCGLDCPFCRENDIVDLEAMDPTVNFDSQKDQAIRAVADAQTQSNAEN